MAFVRTVETTVAAAPERVWSLISDVRRHPEWAYNQLTVEHAGGPAIGPGAEYTFSVSDATPGAKKSVVGQIRVVKSDSPELFIYDCTDDGGTYRWTFEISVWNEQTVVTHTVERLSSPWWVLQAQPLAWAFGGAHQVKGGLAKLKQLAETAEPPQLPTQRQTVDVPEPAP